MPAAVNSACPAVAAAAVAGFVVAAAVGAWKLPDAFLGLFDHYLRVAEDENYETVITKIPTYVLTYTICKIY